MGVQLRRTVNLQPYPNKLICQWWPTQWRSGNDKQWLLQHSLVYMIGWLIIMRQDGEEIVHEEVTPIA